MSEAGAVTGELPPLPTLGPSSCVAADSSRTSAVLPVGKVPHGERPGGSWRGWGANPPALRAALPRGLWRPPSPLCRVSHLLVLPVRLARLPEKSSCFASCPGETSPITKLRTPLHTGGGKGSPAQLLWSPTGPGHGASGARVLNRLPAPWRGA